MKVIVVFPIPFSLIHVKLSKNEHLHLQMDTVFTMYALWPNLPQIMYPPLSVNISTCELYMDIHHVCALIYNLSQIMYQCDN
jgi:hypothetical protein